MLEISAADVRAMTTIIAAAAEPTSNSALTTCRSRLLEGLRGLLAADAWVWIFGQSNPLIGIGSNVHATLDGGWRDEEERQTVFLALARGHLPPTVDALTHNAVLQQAPLTRLRSELLDDAAWHASSAAQAWRAAGFDDVVASVCLVDQTHYSAVGYYRRQEAPPFTQRERSLLDVAFQHIDWVHRIAVREHPCVKAASLSPRERDVLRLLLEGNARKQVASKLDLSTHTVADYLKAIYKKVGVTSRAELLAKFINVNS